MAKYKDQIYDVLKFEPTLIDWTVFPTEKQVIIKTSGPAKAGVDTGNFELVFVHHGVFFYSNINYPRLIPYLYDGYIYALRIVVVINGKRVVGVKHTGTNYYISINGKKQGLESFEECVAREVNEQTGITPTNILSIQPLHQKMYTKALFNHAFKFKSFDVKVVVALDQTQINQTFAHKSDQISTVTLLKLKTCFTVVPNWSPRCLLLMQDAINYCAYSAESNLSEFTQTKLIIMTPTGLQGRHILGVIYKNKQGYSLISGTRVGTETIQNHILREVTDHIQLPLTDIYFITQLPNISEPETLVFRIDVTLTPGECKNLVRSKIKKITGRISSSLEQLINNKSPDCVSWQQSTLDYLKNVPPTKFGLH